MQREYFDIDLKDQSKRRMRSVAALPDFGGMIHDQYESKYFQGRLAWRNPLLLRISLPTGQRWEFIRHTIALGCGLWLAHPERVGVPVFYPQPRLQLRGNHIGLPKRRTYNFRPGYVLDHGTNGTVTYSGVEAVSAILDGNLDLVYPHV